MPIKLIDTAGLRATENEVEKIGVSKAIEVMDSSDLILFILDADSGFEQEDADILEKIEKYHEKTIYVVNKTDKKDEDKLNEIKERIPEVLEISVLEDSGINILEKEIYQYVNKSNFDTDNQLLVTNARHKKHLQQTLADLEKALDGIKAGMTMDVVSIDIKSAAENLGYITGHQVSEEIVTNIFERFCIGK